MKGPIQVRFGLSFLLTLQYSKRVRTCTGKAIELSPGPGDQVSMLNKYISHSM